MENMINILKLFFWSQWCFNIVINLPFTEHEFQVNFFSLTANPCNLNNGGCMQTCIPVGAKNRRCECLDGFRLVGNTSCEDINECAQWPPVCSQKCINEVKGSYKCECMSGYYPEILEDGQHVCKAIGK